MGSVFTHLFHIFSSMTEIIQKSCVQAVLNYFLPIYFFRLSREPVEGLIMWRQAFLAMFGNSQRLSLKVSSLTQSNFPQPILELFTSVPRQHGAHPQWPS